MSILRKRLCLKGLNLTQIIDGYFDIVTYVTAYFPVQTMDPTELWKNVFQLKKHDNDKEDWSFTRLIVEICLCVPYSNAALERFFSLLKYVKSTIRSRLTSDVLNADMKITKN